MLKETLGLNEQHQGIIRSYIKFARHQRGQNLKFIDMTFQDVIDSRLLEDTYTKDEVEELINNMKDVVSGEVAGELMDVSHINVLLFTQLLSQAEKWHLRMKVDLSDVQNRELLEKVKIMEENENKSQPNPHRLEPLADNSSGSFELLKIEIERLKDENMRLEKQTVEYESKLNQLIEEKEKMALLLKAKEEEMTELKNETENLSLTNKNSEVETDSKNDSEQLLGEYEKVLTEQLRLELDSMRQEYLSVQSQLSLAEKELERKFNQTAAYNNMKMMIAKKNEQVKELRTQLQKYEKTSEPAPE
ncbi:leucine zipper transcription factor-like protein 1 isoform X1 [Rhodnius prolixus]|uniref:leucine zipper transcription factor-like protein 1 isoform X1 n=2 Tax=Rhodnius prolixus TaxID=13249 RepID=UPI003D18DF8F